MTEAEQLSSLIGDIYDAALDPDLWKTALPAACEFARSRAAGLYTQDAVKKTGKTYYQCGVPLHYEKLYFEKYIGMDPMHPSLLFFGVEEVHSVADVLPHSEFRDSRFYREWLEPQGFVDGVLSNLEKSATSSAVFILLRHQEQGLVDDEMRRRVRLIVPHVRRAALIGKVIDRYKTEAASFADALDGLAAGLFLVKASGQIVHANASGHAMLADADVLRATGGRLLATDQQVDQTLKEIFAAAERGDTAVGVKGVAVPLRAREGEPFIAHVLPLTSGARRRAGIAYAAVAALFVRKAGLDTCPPLETLAKLHKLTPSELRVLLAVTETGGVPQAAQTLGIAETTVKTHLHRLFEKTGARRQADLVKLLAGYSSPLSA